MKTKSCVWKAEVVDLAPKLPGKRQRLKSSCSERVVKRTRSQSSTENPKESRSSVVLASFPLSSDSITPIHDENHFKSPEVLLQLSTMAVPLPSPPTGVQLLVSESIIQSFIPTSTYTASIPPTSPPSLAHPNPPSSPTLLNTPTSPPSLVHPNPPPSPTLLNTPASSSQSHPHTFPIQPHPHTSSVESCLHSSSVQSHPHTFICSVIPTHIFHPATSRLPVSAKFSK